jgi:hypothetical protein
LLLLSAQPIAARIAINGGEGGAALEGNQAKYRK